MRRNYKILLSTVMLLLVFLVSLSFSYARYQNKKVLLDDAVILADEYLSVNYLNGNYYDETFLDANDTIVKKLSVTNVSNEDTFFTIAIMDVNKENDNLNIRLIDNTNKEYFNSTLGNIDTEILKTATIKSKETKSFTILLTNNGPIDNYGLTANIMVYKENIQKDVKTFAQTLLENNPVNTDNNASGLFKSIDNDGDTYYFRGNVSNNYVKMGDQLWRIIRINGDGSIRLVLDGVLPDKYAYIETINMEDKFSNILFSKSNAYQTLNTWLTSSLASYTDYIAKSNFCSDSTLSYTDNAIEYISSYSRVMVDNNASLNCVGTIEKLNIGLLSIDEVVYAGLNSTDINQTNYLYSNVDDAWWTLSGSMILNNANVIDLFAINNLGKITTQNKLTAYLYLKPVISLDKNISVTGEGTKENPYTF